ncbi:MAG: hypothetical protein ABL940_13045, partial [Bacteroidia bacterium]
MGSELNGTWTLKICDMWAQDEGDVWAFGVNFDPSVFVDLTKLSPTIGIGADSSYLSGPSQISLSANADKLCANVSTAGIVAYTYTVKNSFGCTHDTTFNINITPSPVADFTASNVCLGATTQFSNNTISVSAIASYLWAYDGTGILPPPTSTTQNSSYTFVSCTPLSYNTTLKVIANNGCESSVTKPVIIYCLPEPSFTANNGCEKDETISFTNTSTNGANTTGTLTYDWDLVQSTSTLANPTLNYITAGIKNIKLKVTDINTCFKESTIPISIYPKPTANFSIINACAGLNTTFNDASTLTNPIGINDNITSYQWTYEALNNTFTPDATTQNTTHSYASPSVITPHTAALIVTTDKGCIDTIMKPVNTFPNPVAAFSTDSVCFNTATTFTDATTLASGSIKNWTWIFGGTAIVPVPTSTLQNPTFVYDKCNNAPNNATLIVTSDSGCVNTLTQAVTVRCLPVPNFTFNNGCEKDDRIQFTNTSTNGAGTTGALISKWRLGLSPLPIVALSPSQVYNAPGNYSINLIATDKYGCTETVTKSLVIYPKPTANFTIDSVCLNVANTFTNTTTLSVPAGFNDVMSAYNWTYNYTNNYTTDAITASSSHIYTLPATQAIPTVALIVKTNNNCADT